MATRSKKLSGTQAYQGDCGSSLGSTPDVASKKCGNCKHWKKEKEYRWGTCNCPVPAWVEGEEKPNNSLIFPEDEMADFCEMFEKKSSKGEKQ